MQKSYLDSWKKKGFSILFSKFFPLNVEIPDDVAKKVGVDSVDDVPVPDVPVPDVVVEKKVCAFRFSDFDLDEDELPELANFKDSKELNDFLDKDDEESVALRVKIFQLGLKALRKDGDAYSTAIEIFTE